MSALGERESDVLRRLLDIGGRITTLIRTGGNGITWDNAFQNDLLLGLRDDLMGLLGATDTAGALLTAARILGAEWDRMAAESHDEDGIHVDLMPKMSTAAMTARALTYLAKAEAMTTKQVFIFTLRQVLPWLEQAVKLSVLVIGAVV